MEKPKNQKGDYLEFLRNPQEQGVWAISIQPDAGSLDSIRTLLNLGEMGPYRYHYIEGESNEVSGVPCCIIPRLLGYLRYLVPAKSRQELPPLFIFEREPWMLHRGMARHRFGASRFLHELTSEPRRLSAGKRRALSRAASIFKSRFLDCSISTVPERPSALDIISHRDHFYFQTQEDADGRIMVYSVQENICNLVKGLLDEIPGVRFTSESRKLFSPETQLLAMYLPTLAAVSPESILRDATMLRTIGQTVSEVREERFVHAIRAIGIGAEELIVEIYETYLHDKAPEAPLGNLLTELNTRIQEIVGGAKPRKNARAVNLKKILGTALGAEKKKANSNPELCRLIETVLQVVVPGMEQLASSVGEIHEVAARPQKTLVFPATVNRSLSDLVPLRNRVSHRVDRLSAARAVTYLEAALALKSYIVLCLWWQEEQQKIDYRVGMKEAIKKAIERNSVEVAE